MSSEELTEWMAFHQDNPFGLWRQDLHAGIIAATIANVYAKKGHRFTPDDFMPQFYKPPKRAMTAEDMVAAMRRAAGT